MWDELVAQVNELARHTRLDDYVDFADPRQAQLTALSGVLALYQAADVMQAHPGLNDRHAISAVPAHGPIEQLLKHVDVHVVADVNALMCDAVSGLPRPELVRHARAEVRMGAAAGRGDLLLDDLLLEVKVITRLDITAEYAYQLLDYLLGSEVEVADVGWYFARHAALWTLRVEDFLSVLAGEPVNTRFGAGR